MVPFVFEYFECHPKARKPVRATKNSIGYDVFTPVEIEIYPGERQTIPLGFKSKFTEGYMAILWDKSGLASKQGLTILAGLIDPDYPDEWGAVILNTGRQVIKLKAGDKICQIVFIKAEFPLGLMGAEDKQRKGGFGSTGK